MTHQNINPPSVSAVAGIEFQHKIPELINLNYDLSKLKLILCFEQNQQIEVIFKNVIGFRVLDEGDLLEFWDPNVRAAGWIWKVESGGWFDLEKTRTGFLTGYQQDLHPGEYLVLGINDCVNIFSVSEPEFIYHVIESTE